MRSQIQYFACIQLCPKACKILMFEAIKIIDTMYILENNFPEIFLAILRNYTPSTIKKINISCNFPILSTYTCILEYRLYYYKILYIYTYTKNIHVTRILWNCRQFSIRNCMQYENSGMLRNVVIIAIVYVQYSG